MLEDFVESRQLVGAVDISSVYFSLFIIYFIDLRQPCPFLSLSSQALYEPTWISESLTMGRFRQIAAAFTALAVLVAVYLARASPSTEVEPTPTVQGKNGTVLFFINTEYGLSNVHLATTGALLEKHPGIDVHIASFPRLASKVAKVASLPSRSPRPLKIFSSTSFPVENMQKRFQTRWAELGGSPFVISFTPLE